ncbi:MAG: gliding motility-associated C-terminal domain-containing protein [Bacteroidia bacterium]|nr:gliding motility-associated C-terminal domain-containing protein [Bacteroidia bacterium]
MRIKHFNIILVFVSFWSYSAHSQINCSTDPPLPPVLTTVSVQPETGNTEITWNLSPSTDIAAYVLYSYANGDGMPIDTLWDPSTTSYTLSSTATKYKSVSYVVAAMRLPRCTSIFSNVINSIYTRADMDTCNKKIVVSWNSYPSYPKKVTDYSILMSVNDGIFTENAKVNPEEDSFTFNDFTTDAKYFFIVRANLEGGTFSTSNKDTLLTKMQRPPRWINADYASINDENKVSLSFTIDPLSEINLFRLEKKNGPIGTFQEIAQLSSANGSILFTDNQADINTINYYILSAINNCNIPVTVSNIASNMVLSLERTGNDLNLSWNSYKDWLGVISSYRLFINTGKGFEEKVVIQPADTLFTLGYQELMYEVAGSDICFYISVSETSNPYGVNGQSISSRICTVPTEIITVPNVFTPNNDLLNDFFKPVLSFTPLDYHLIISDRQGNILFETRDFLAEWDGSQNGNPQPQGVCLWFLKVTTPSGKSISKTGTLTIIRSRE